MKKHKLEFLIIIIVFYLTISYIWGYGLLASRNINEICFLEGDVEYIYSESKLPYFPQEVLECEALYYKNYNEANFWKGAKFLTSPLWSPIVKLGQVIK